MGFFGNFLVFKVKNKKSYSSPELINPSSTFIENLGEKIRDKENFFDKKFMVSREGYGKIPGWRLTPDFMWNPFLGVGKKKLILKKHILLKKKGGRDGEKRGKTVTEALLIKIGEKL